MADNRVDETGHKQRQNHIAAKLHPFSDSAGNNGRARSGKHGLKDEKSDILITC